MINKLLAFSVLTVLWIIPATSAASAAAPALPTLRAAQDYDPCPEHTIAKTDTILVQGGWNARITNRETGQEYMNLIVADPWDNLEPERHMERCARAVFSPDETLLAVSATGLHIFDTATWEELPLEATSAAGERQTYGMAWDASGRYLAFEDLFALYLLDIERDESTLVLETEPLIEYNNGGLRIAPVPVDVTPDGNWLEVNWRYFEGGSRGIVSAVDGTTLFRELETYDRHCTTVHWWIADPMLVAMTCAGWTTSGVASVYHLCILSDPVVCAEEPLDGNVSAKGWTANGNLLVEVSTTPAEPPSECYLIRVTTDGEWVPAACDTPTLTTADMLTN